MPEQSAIAVFVGGLENIADVPLLKVCFLKFEIIPAQASVDFAELLSGAPEDEVRWLLHRVWNQGVELFANKQQKQALDFCNIAMKLLDYVADAPKKLLTPILVRLYLNLASLACFQQHVWTPFKITCAVLLVSTADRL